MGNFGNPQTGKSKELCVQATKKKPGQGLWKAYSSSLYVFSPFIIKERSETDATRSFDLKGTSAKFEQAQDDTDRLVMSVF
mmetsp:Transcript_42945/g.58636  ORF Transcript_42945/g.58636 Transcript_42945/m.58636 type:complete len:81 (+) Transcript_42945:420-662(+)